MQAEVLRLRSDVAEEQGRLRTRNARPPRPPLPDHVELQGGPINGDPEEEAQEVGTQEQQADAQRRRGLRNRFMQVSLLYIHDDMRDIWRGVFDNSEEGDPQSRSCGKRELTE
jgi:hypothetical protein